MGVQNLLNRIKFKTNDPLQNYYIPLTSKVEELVPTYNICNLQVGPAHNPSDRRVNRQVRYTLPQQHKEKDSTQFWRQPRSITICDRVHWSHACSNKREHPKKTMMTEQQVKKGVLEGSIPSSA